MKLHDLHQYSRKEHHTTMFMQVTKYRIIHQSLCMKLSLELISFLASTGCMLTQIALYSHGSWAYSMNAEYFLLWEFITFALWNTHFEQYLKLLISRKHSRHAFFGTDYLTDTDTKKIIQPHMHTHTHTQSDCVPCILNTLEYLTFWAFM
jgi:hypothetical protein